MKVFAESQPPRSSLYIHLGYLATTSLKPLPGFVESGLLLGLLGALLTFRLQRGHNPAGRPTHLVKFRRVGAVVVGLTAFASGMALSWMGHKLGAQVPDHPEQGTRVQLRSLEDLILPEAWQEQQTHLRLSRLAPGEYDAEMLLRSLNFTNATLWHPRRRMTRDGWGNRLRIEVARAGGRWQLAVLSPGPDGAPHTQDDLRHDFRTPLLLEEPAGGRE